MPIFGLYHQFPDEDPVNMSTNETAAENTSENRNERNRNNNDRITGINALLYLMFRQGSILYANIFPEPVRRTFEFILLIKAFSVLFILIYVHTILLNAGSHCLDYVQNEWPRDGILRVEINQNYYRKDGNSDLVNEIQNINNDYDNERRFEDNYKNVIEDSLHVYSDGLILQKSSYRQEDQEISIGDGSDVVESSNQYESVESESTINENEELELSISEIDMETEKNDKLINFQADVKKLEILTDSIYYPENYYVVEYSLEFALLKLQKQTRRRLKIPVLTIKLDPDQNKCFSDSFSRFLLKEFFGYRDFLIYAMQSVAEKEGNRGFVKDLSTGKVYEFVAPWISKATYIVAFFIMLVFTLTMSILMRYTYLQFYMYILSLIQYMEYNERTSYSFAPLLTVVFAIVGMEATMTEFFADPETAFYLMFIVYVADFFDAVCCRTQISRRHWLKFFFLYHYAFYAYHFRYRNEYSYLALVTSCLFICHSMVYFFHHFELPEILASEGTENVDNPFEMFDDHINDVNINTNRVNDQRIPTNRTRSNSSMTESVEHTDNLSVNTIESSTSQPSDNIATLSQSEDATSSGASGLDDLINSSDHDLRTVF